MVMSFLHLQNIKMIWHDDIHVDCEKKEMFFFE
jgi:hypothetical protein